MGPFGAAGTNPYAALKVRAPGTGPQESPVERAARSRMARQRPTGVGIRPPRRQASQVTLSAPTVKF
jgi:hypothetical protein